MTRELFYGHELVVVMDAQQRDWVVSRYPEGRAKVVMMTRWRGNGNIADPFRRSKPVYSLVYQTILACCDDWVSHLGGKV